MPGRTYVQPQWVWDCLNQGKLLRPDLYAPGAELPPHLSPWVKPKSGEYDPNRPLQEQELEGEAEAAEDEDDDEEMAEQALDEKLLAEGADPAALLDRENSVEAGEGMDVDDSEDDDDEDSEDDADAGADAWDGIESDAESDISAGEAARLQHQRELEAEALGKKLEPKVETTKSKNAAIRKKAEKKRREEQEEKDRQKMMLSNKKRKLLKRIEYGQEKQNAESETLRKKRRRVEKAKAAAEAV
jgi:pescadillo protein